MMAKAGSIVLTVLAVVALTSVQGELSARVHTEALSNPPNHVAPATNSATVKVNPPNQNVSWQETFTVDIAVEGAEDLAAYEFAFEFDSDVVRVEKVEDGGFLGSTGNDVSTSGPHDYGPGRIRFSAVASGLRDGPSGTGTLAIVTLCADSGGTSSLMLDDVHLYNTSAAEQDVSSVQDGAVVVEGPVLDQDAFLPAVLCRYQRTLSDVGIGYIREESSDEYIRIVNHGTGGQDMTGWKVQSYANKNGNCEPTGQCYWFPSGYLLDVGASVRVHSGPDADDNPPGDLKWTTSYIWHNDGDVGVLYDAEGDEVDRYAYGECR